VVRSRAKSSKTGCKRLHPRQIMSLIVGSACPQIQQKPGQACWQMALFIHVFDRSAGWFRQTRACAFDDVARTIDRG
jgi:hypothetical protein